jgi:hypothetical protein
MLQSISRLFDPCCHDPHDAIPVPIQGSKLDYHRSKHWSGVLLRVLDGSYSAKKETNVIKFYSVHGDYSCFSNFSPHPIKLKGQTWFHSEGYFQAQKFVGTKHESDIRKMKSASGAASAGRDRSKPLRRDWESVKDDIMREAVYAKFTQHKDIQKILLGTGDEKLIEHTDKDSYWADGGNGSGKNMLGIILMETRERIRKETLPQS